MKFGVDETVFLLAVFGAIFTLIKIAQSELKRRKEEKKINEVISDPELLKEKLNNPEIELNGKIRKIEKVCDKEEDQKERLNYDINKENELELKRQKVEKPKETKKESSKKKVKKKNKKKVKKKNKKNGKAKGN